MTKTVSGSSPELAQENENSDGFFVSNLKTPPNPSLSSPNLNRRTLSRKMHTLHSEGSKHRRFDSVASEDDCQVVFVNRSNTTNLNSKKVSFSYQTADN